MNELFIHSISAEFEMKRQGPILILVFIALAAFPSLAATVSCECEDNACGPCEIETGVTFYSAKCGPELARVKSCKKPTCVPVENQKTCLALLKKSSSSGEAQARSAAVTTPEKRQQAVSAGEITNVTGFAQVLRAEGPVETAKKGLNVNVGDTLETRADGKVKVRLKDESEMIVAAGSRVTIQNVAVDREKSKRNITLDLVMGRVRNRVNKKFDTENVYTVKTRTAVAGVRGTDFVASFQPGETEWVSEVRTFEGMVHLESARSPDADPNKPVRAVDVPGGTYAAFVIGPPAHLDNEAEFFKSIEEGRVTAVYKMSEEDRASLDTATEFENPDDLAKRAERDAFNRAIASNESLCSSPKGTFNQCSFTCEGNPAGEKLRCRTDLPGVACVRRLCRANGAWVEPKRLPASESTRCQPNKTLVTDCGSYW